MHRLTTFLSTLVFCIVLTGLAYAGEAKEPDGTAPIDINSASVEQLMRLTGIKELDARKVIDGRPYQNVTELASNNVLSQAAFDRIEDRVIAPASFESDMKNNLPIYIAIIWMLIVVAGTVLGFMKKITVYRNYDDIGLVFLMMLLPFVAVMASQFLQDIEKNVFYALLGVFGCAEVFLFVVSGVRTYQDNSNIVTALVALLTKLTLSVLFLYNLIRLISPGGHTHLDNRRGRENAALWLLVLAPIVYGLVRDKVGIFNPEKTLQSRLAKT